MAAILPIILAGLTALPSVVQLLQTLFTKGTPIAAQTAAINGVADVALQVATSVSTGGQADTLKKAQSILPLFHDLTANLMALAESTGQPGAQKADYVTKAMTDVMTGWEQLSTGGQATTAAQIVPAVQTAVNSLVPILFPKVLGSPEQPAN